MSAAALAAKNSKMRDGFFKFPEWRPDRGSSPGRVRKETAAEPDQAVIIYVSN